MIDVIVFGAPGRDEAHRRCFASIEASDIGKNYTLMLHPEGMHKNEHWKQTHLRAAEAKSEFVLVLEDDVLVNRFILENIDSWRWKWNKDFGAGWVYRPGGYGKGDTWYMGARPWAMTPGVVYRTADLPRYVEGAMKLMAPGARYEHAWDCAIAWAATENGKRIRVHNPSLVEHMNDVPSKLGNTNKSVLRTSKGTFRETWRRPKDDANGIVDRFGRPVNPNQR